MEKHSLLEEIKSYNPSFLKTILWDQKHNQKWIEDFCEKCIFHGQIFYDGNIYHTCNDVWSGTGDNKSGVGKHVFYFETRDICIESDGFKEREK